jgi:hypothetical protein
MIKNLQNPLDLVICLKLLNVISLSDEESEQRINSILKTHLGSQFAAWETEAARVLDDLGGCPRISVSGFLNPGLACRSRAQVGCCP